ncbi:MAG: exodeoxyribonuclease VII large subunit [Burkholderiales bacterium]|nr:MAG: exodeoxyribonuclease VII large subunit [Burkholderiales bacterium]
MTGFVDRIGPESPVNTGFGHPGAVDDAGRVLSVSELNRRVNGLLERSFPLLWVGGELSNFTRAASGHWYFTLKDASAQVRAVMFRGHARLVDFAPREGDRIEVRGLVTLYEPRGDFQLRVEQMQRAGQGDLYAQFLRLKQKLAAEGLFDADRKRALPPAPRTIGVVTSARAAALRDVLITLGRRAPDVAVIVYPTPVQGAEAPASIVAAIEAANRRAECELLLLVRGGGSIEDLWAFNDERVARAVAASALPVVCGVGHETDFTIADFVADLRAPTPTAAAQLAAPDRGERLRALAALGQRLARAFGRRFERGEQRLDTAARLLRPPSARWRERAHALGTLAARISAAARACLQQQRFALADSAGRLRPPSLEARIGHAVALERAQARAASQRVAAARARLDAAAAGLELVSPPAVLARGYAIVTGGDRRIVRDSDQLTVGAAVRVALARGAFDARVSATHPPEPSGANGIRSDGMTTDGMTTDGMTTDGMTTDGMTTDGTAPDERQDARTGGSAKAPPAQGPR